MGILGSDCMTHPGRHGAANTDHGYVKNIPHVDGNLMCRHRRITERRNKQGDCGKHARLQKEGEADRKADGQNLGNSTPVRPIKPAIRQDTAGSSGLSGRTRK